MKNIIKIIEKYYNGETSDEEESRLRKFCLQEIRQSAVSEKEDKTNRELQMPAQNLNFERAMFEFCESERKIELNDEFDKKIIDKINEKTAKKIIFLKSSSFYRLAGIAATILLVIGFYLITYNNSINDKKKATLTEDEKFALTQTIETLTTVSDYLNLANEQIEGLSIINNSLEPLYKVSDIEKYNQYVLYFLGAES